MHIDVSLEHIPDKATLEREWLDLESRTDASYCRSWAWVETWMDVLGHRAPRSWLVARADGAIVGIGLIGDLVTKRLGRTRSLHLNSTGIRSEHMGLTHNGFLIRPDIETSVIPACLSHLEDGLRARDWDRVVLGWVPPSYMGAERGDRVCRVARFRQPDYYVDLEAVRRRGDYTALLSRRTRKNMRRSRNLYSRKGPLELSVAASLEEANAYLDRLIELHQAVWTARGWPGNFADPLVLAFHRELLRRRFASDEIQLCRVRAGEADVGYLYNFVYKGRVFAFQQGVCYEDRNAYQPGRMCDWLAIEHCAGCELRTYDLLVGDTQFKRSLATHVEERVWMLIRRDARMDRWEERVRSVVVPKLLEGRVHRWIARRRKSGTLTRRREEP